MFYCPKTLLAVITLLNLPFLSYQLRSHFLLMLNWLKLYVNNILFFLQSLKELNEILWNDSPNTNIHPQGDSKRQQVSSIASTILRYPWGWLLLLLVEPQSVTPTTKNKDQEIMSTRQQYGGLKIPTIVNGIINLPRRSKLSKIKSSVIPCKVPPCKIPQSKKHDK